MASNASWRFSFTDVDSSLVEKVSKDEVIGAMAIRSPKGPLTPRLFAAGNGTAIKEYYGAPNANWPDIFEAIDFNKSYPLYISAPAGSSASFPSYYGGIYLTDNGTENFYNVSNVDSVEYLKAVLADTEATVDVEFAPFESVQKNFDKTTTIAFVISGIKTASWSKTDQIGLEYWGNSKTGFEASTVYFNIDKKTHKIYFQKEDGSSDETAYSGIWFKNGKSYTIILGGDSWFIPSYGANYGITDGSNIQQVLASYAVASATSSNTVSDLDIPLLSTNTKAENLEKIISLAVDAGQTDEAQAVWTAATSTYKNKGEWDAESYFIDGQYKTDTSIIALPETIGQFDGIIDLIESIKDSTYFTIYQRSPTSQKTVVKISNIGYDKYKYDEVAPMLFANVGIAEVPSTVLDQFADYGKFIFVTSGDSNEVGSTVSAKYYSFKDSDPDKSVLDVVTLLSDAYLTKSILVSDVVAYSGSTKATEDISTKSPWYHQILTVASSSKLGVQTTKSTAYPLIEASDYNQITISCSEVIDGETISGGSFTGSLSETGEDSRGNLIFFPNVLNDEDFSFISIAVNKTFDDLLDAHGIYTGNRIIDDKMIFDTNKNTMSASKTVYLQGQRWMEKSVEDNLLNDLPGGQLTDDQESALLKSYDVYSQSDFDDVYLFMDPAASEEIQEKFASIRTTSKSGQMFATFLSSRSLSDSEAETPSTIVVHGQAKGCAQLVNEFKFYDSSLGKFYYRTLVGPYGVKCADIMKNKNGGAAPAWMDYNGMGGQLSYSGTCLDQKWKFTEDDLETMDGKGLNPVTMDQDGVMVTSQKTTYSPDVISDWSYLAHSMSFDIFKRNVRDQVMRPQIMKPINDTFMTLRENQVKDLIGLRTSGPKKCWTEGTCIINDSRINNDQTKAQRQFRILVRVKVEPLTETISLTFENVGQTMSVYDDDTSAVTA